MSDYPQAIVPVNHVEPVPRRVRAFLGGQPILDTTAARYVWEWPYYPQYYVPITDLAAGVLVDEHQEQSTHRGPAYRHGLRVGECYRPGAAKVLNDSPIDELSGTVRLDWEALDCWFEEDEQIFVHPRNPYARVDALRSSRRVRIELDGVLLAESGAPVMVFETGLPTRYYVDRTAVRFEHLVASDTVTACPYKGVTSGYWSVRIGDTLHEDFAWSYDFPTRQLLPIAGLVAFYNEKVDVSIDGVGLDRLRTHFSAS